MPQRKAVAQLLGDDGVVTKEAHMVGLNRKTLRALAASLVGAAILGGCIYSKETTTERTVPGAVVVTAAPVDKAVTYPEGRYQLYGEGTRTAPYYWVWIPSGRTSVPTPPPPPPLPPSR